MNQTDWHIKAVAYWQKANQNLKIFAEACYNVENKTALASDCGCNPRTIQLYAAAWSLYQEMTREYGSETVSPMWERGEISLWRKAPQLRNGLHLSLEDTRYYLETAISAGMDRDTFAAVVDEKENRQPLWQRALLGVVDRLGKIQARWITSMPQEKRDRYEAAVNAFYAALEEIAADEETKTA